MDKLFSDLPYILNAKDVQRVLGISQSSVYDLLHRKDFPTLHVNARLLVRKEDLFAWIKQNTNTSSILQAEQAPATPWQR